MDAVRLRPALPEDAEFLCAVYSSTRAEELAVTGWSDVQKAAFCRQQFDAQDAHYRMHYPTAEYSIIEATLGVPALGGSLGVPASAGPPKGGTTNEPAEAGTQNIAVGRLYVDRWTREIRIMDIALLPEHRGAGIGTRLLRELQEEARAAGKALSIHVEKFNPALRLYERLGFRAREDKGVYLLMEVAATPPSQS